MNVIGQLLPVDGYYISLEKPLVQNYLQSLTHLYQPLIGPEALMLYQTLLTEIELQENSVPQTHHTLMNYLTLPLDKIYEARLKLEGIGLLKTYKKVQEGTTIYYYELQNPYDPVSFFKEAMLTSLLYHHLGDQKFERLEKFYLSHDNEINGENVTVDFQDVFQTFTPSKEGLRTIPEESKTEEVNDVEFEWLRHLLKARMIPVNRVLTTENRKLISQMLILYELETFEVDKAVLWALTDENYLDVEEFKVACHDLFKAKNNNKPIRLVEKQVKTQPEIPNKKPQTKEDLLIQELETISPKQLLEDLSSGNHASEQDMRAIREVMTTQGLPAPVMNVLIHYVLLQSNMKLSKAYLEKIASHWSRAKLQTAKEAMYFAKKEKERFEQAKAKRPTTNYQRAANSQDIIPDWFKEGKHMQSKPQETNQKDMSDEQERIANLIKQYSEGN